MVRATAQGDGGRGESVKLVNDVSACEISRLRGGGLVEEGVGGELGRGAQTEL